ncbi:MAG: selenocysteine-specific translation factor, partial [Desulfobacterales bacterium]|nr:selenocysteine-specific translation factor [Desulfobacterales bacterium]
ESVDDVEAGHRTAINLQNVDTVSIYRGMVLATPGCLEPNYMLDCSLLYLNSNHKPLKHRTRVRVHLGTAELMGRVSLLECDELQPGAEVSVQLLLESPVAVWPGDRYVIRSYSPVATIGGGEVMGNQSPRKRKRLTDKDRAYNNQVFSILHEGSLEEKMLLYLRESGMKGLTFDELAVHSGIFGKHLSKNLSIPLSAKRIVVVDSTTQRYLTREIADEVTQTIISSLTSYHEGNPLRNGLSKEELRSGFKREIDQKVFNYCLHDLIRKDVIIQEESVVRMTTHQVALKADEEKLKRDLKSWYIDKGLSTATIKETYEEFSEYPKSLVKEVFDLLLKDGTIIKISESLYYASEHINALEEKVVSFIQQEGEIDAPRFKQLSGLTRKFSIPILEYFDRIKITMRIGDKRILRKK